MTEFQDSDTKDEQHKLLLDVAGLRDRSEFHDVTFVCRDGVQVAANRVFLAVRCEFFDRLLFGTLRESRQEEILLPSVSSASLTLVFEFLHTCDVQTLNPDTMAVEAYDLARQYDLPGLQKLIVGFLVRHARETATNVGEIISSALSLRAMDVAEQILPVASEALEVGCVDLFDGFSVEALVFSLKHESLRAGRPLEMDVFNAVLCWAVSMYTDHTVDKSVGNDFWCGLTPGAVEDLKAVVCDPERREAQDWRRVLEGVRLECVPTKELEEKVEELGLVPMELLLKAYRTQATRFARVALKASLWDATAKGSEVRIEQERCRFESKTHQGARTQASFTTGVHTWKIEVEEYCDLVWVGVVDDSVCMEHWLGKQQGGWMYGSNGTLCHNTTQDNGPYTNKYGVAFREGVIEVKLDMHKREMGFVVNGINYGVAFRNLGQRVFPAVSCRSPGLVRVVFGDKVWSLLGPPTM
ncbi:hypothetical protein BSKO_12218 [Bryopsis sp. KO-2023]|nr:hypothetical protein BSKO_12218 [Bryopsis sp. KO-2023]